MIALGDGANLAAAWAFHPGAAVTIEGHPSDLSALALISPMPEGSGYLLRHVTPSLATRIPMLLLAGERDGASKDAVQASPAAGRARPAQQDRALPLLAPRLQAPSARAQGHLDPLPLPRHHAQEPRRRLGAPVQPPPRHLLRHPDRPHTRPDDPLRKAAADRKAAGEARAPAKDAKAADPPRRRQPKRNRPRPRGETAIPTRPSTADRDLSFRQDGR